MFSICEEPIVLSGSQALAFVWKGDALWTKTIDTNKNEQDKKWTSFILPARDPYPLPKLEEFGEFLCAALTFTRSLAEIRVFVNDKKRMTIVKTQIQEPTTVQIQQNSSWWKSDGAIIALSNFLWLSPLVTAASAVAIDLLILAVELPFLEVVNEFAFEFPHPEQSHMPEAIASCSFGVSLPLEFCAVSVVSDFFFPFSPTPANPSALLNPASQTSWNRALSRSKVRTDLQTRRIPSSSFSPSA